MTHHKIDDREHLLVGIPKEASNCRIDTGELCYNTSFGECDDNVVCIPLPLGEWQLVDTSDALTHDDCRKLVARHHIDQSQYKDYMDFKNRWASEKVSFMTLLASLSLTRCAILQRVR